MTAPALARIERLLAAARPLSDPATSVGREARRRLVASSGLSAEGIELALSEHLEVEPTREDLRRLVEDAAPLKHGARAWVLLSANVVTGALRALALALAAGSRVAIRPSRRDPALAELLVEQLRRDPELERLGGEVELVSELRPVPGDHVFAYGSDRTLEQAMESWPAEVSRSLFGTGFGVAVVGAGADLGKATERLARDVIVFDQRGCLSPRIAFAGGSADRIQAFGHHLSAALDRWQVRVPRGDLDRDEAIEISTYAQTAACIGTVHRGEAHVVGVDDEPQAVPLPPTARTVHVVAASAHSVDDLLRPHARYVTAVGVTASRDPLALAVAAACPAARLGPLGAMQRPPLDGPVDRRGAPRSR